MNEHYIRSVGEQGVGHLITTARIHPLPYVEGIRVLHTLKTSNVSSWIGREIQRVKVGSTLNGGW